MADQWLVIENKSDGREYEVTPENYERMGAGYWPGFVVRGFKDGSKYTAPKPVEPEAVVVTKAKGKS
jgi:hypothetical protein